jgi:hypothetical protein
MRIRKNSRNKFPNFNEKRSFNLVKNWKIKVPYRAVGVAYMLHPPPKMLILDSFAIVCDTLQQYSIKSWRLWERSSGIRED